MIGSTIFLFLRLLQIVTLIPIWGMLAYFIDKYSSSSSTPPASILVLFIVSLIATVWAMVTLFQFHRYSVTSMLVTFVDLLLFGALIAGVWFLRAVKNADCSNWSSPVDFDAGGGSVSASWTNNWGLSVKKHCTMYKASWILGIINVVLFFFTAILALHLYRRTERKETHREKRVRRSTRRSRW